MPDVPDVAVADLLECFTSRLGSTTPTLTFATALAAMRRFYVEVRVARCVIADDGDMLLVQWNPAFKKPGVFVVDICRQLITDEQDAEPTQLHLQCMIENANTFSAGDRWCETPDALNAFVAELLALPVAAACAAPQTWTLMVEDC